MSGRYEKELRIDNKMKEQLNELPRVISDYYYSIISSGKSYVTAKSYIYHIDKFLNYISVKPYPEDFYKNIDSNMINRFISDLRMGNVSDTKKKRMSDSYLTTSWSALNSFFDFLVPDYIKENPVTLTKRPKQRDNPEVTFLNEKEIQIMFDNVVALSESMFTNRDLAILKLGFATGLRVSEIVQIDIDDIDFSTNRIKVTGKGDRIYDVMMGHNLRKQIKMWLKDREIYFKNVNTNALFVSKKHSRLAARTVNDLIERYSKSINKHVTPHVMRHSCATNLYEKTGDIYLCASQLHHKNVTTTQRYAEMSKEKQKKATSILDDLI